jgi:hypothetical protein
MTSSAHYTMIVFGLIIALLGCASTVQADSVTVYPVQAGLVDDGSCCSPYTYTNSSSSTFVLTGCFDSYYGCGYDLERGAWRWNLEGQVPEGADVTSAYIRWDQPSSCWASTVDVWIDANTQVLSSSYCAQMRGGSDQTYYNQAYSGSAASWTINPPVIQEALAGGYLSLQTDNGTGGDGCTIYSTGPQGIRVIINYTLPEVMGACCYELGNCSDGLTQEDCDAADGSWSGADSSCTDVVCETNEIVQFHHAIVGSGLLSIEDPNWTVDVYAAVPEGMRVDAVAGNNLQQKMITSTHGFYQHSNGGPTSVDINPYFYEFVPDLEWDSRVTIGALDETGAPFDSNQLGSVGIDWTNFENGGDLSVGNGTWYILPIDQQGQAMPFISQDCTEQHGVLIARLTTMGLDSTVMVEALVQGRDAGGSTWQDSANYMFDYQANEDCNENMIPDSCDIANGTSNDTDDNGIPDECESGCEGDVDGDGDADVDDMLNLISAWGEMGSHQADLNDDQIVDVNDLLILLDWFGNC